MVGYSGLVVFEADGESVYLDVTIDDLDAAGWVGLADLAEPLSGLSTVGACRVKLVGDGHERRGQTASAQVDCDPDGALRFGGQTAFV
jgi:hypothetical protein